MRYATAFISIALFLAGCSGGGADGDAPVGVELHEAGGKVLFKGQPVEGATVTFQPKTTGRGAYARTDSNGVFTLNTFAESEGAVAGDYVVTVTKHAPPANQLSNEEARKLLEAGKQPPVPPPPVSLLPAKYADATQSGLTASVTADGENQFEFALTE